MSLTVQVPGREPVTLAGSVLVDSGRPPVEVEHQGRRYRWTFTEAAPPSMRPLAHLEEARPDGWRHVVAAWADEPLDVASALAPVCRCWPGSAACPTPTPGEGPRPGIAHCPRQHGATS